MWRFLLVAALWLLLPSGVDAQVINATTTVSSATIATGNTFQQILPAITQNDPPRRSLTIENNNSTGRNCWVHIGAGTPTVSNSILLGQGGSYTRYYPFVPSDAFQATCAATGDVLYVDFQ